MASARRPRTSFRPVTKCTEGGTGREEDAGEKSKQRKRKLADMLGPPWSKVDLEQFYQAFRRHGKDWKKVLMKVSGSLHKRTVEMVEALYTTNKAYLSLPEGAASAAGLIAMMTDHYNLLDGSQSPDEETSNEIAGSDDPSNHAQPAKSRKGGESVAMESSSIRLNGLVGSTSSGGPSPAKKPRTNRSRTVGKRTPRFPSSALDKRAKINKVSHSKLQDRVEDDAVSNMGPASNQVSKGAASPSGSNTPSRRSLRQATVQSNGDKEFLLRTFSDASVKPAASTSEAGVVQDNSPESKELQFDGVAKESSSNLGDGRSGGAARSPAVADSSMKSKRGTPKKAKVPNTDEKHKSMKSLERRKEDAKELIEAAERKNSGGGEDPAEDPSQMHSAQRRRRLVSPPQRPKKRSRQLFSGDSNSGLDALATLAASSLDGLELEGLELGESLNVVANAAACLEDKVESVEAKSGQQSMSKVKQSSCDARLQEGEIETGLEDTGAEVVGERKAEEQGVSLDDRQLSISPPDSGKRKRRLSGDKFPKGQVSTAEGEPTAMLKSRIKVKRTDISKTLYSKQEPNLVKEAVDVLPEIGESVSHGVETSMDGGGESAMEIDESSLPLKLRSKKKGLPEKLSAEKIISLPAPLSGAASIYKEPPKREPPFCPHTTHDLSSASAKARIIHCLCPKVRRWCMCEWFYSAIDLPWFSRNEFVEYLNHAGLGHVPRLTRVEWGVIRGSLGKPRRLSKRFLQEEREKLETYRESVRTHYHELRTGVRDGLPTDLARPLTVGQKVIARHPKTSEIHDGSILTVDRSRCRVQFDRPELGVELVSDIDAMPIHPLENMPEVMRRRRVLVDGIDRSLLEDQKVDVKPKSWSDSGVGGAARAALNEQLERPLTVLSQRFLNDLSKRAQADTLDAVREAKEVTNRAVLEAKEVSIDTTVATLKVGQHPSYTLAQLQAREADVRALADLSRSLDKKEALVMELRQMNDEAISNHDDIRTSEIFQRQYATVVLQLKEVNKEVTSALLHLRLRNKYQDNAVPPWHRSTPQGIPALGSPDMAEHNASCVVDTSMPAFAEMTVLARKQAHRMVTTAVKAMDGLKVGDDALQKLGCALEAIPRTGSASAPSPLPAHVAPAMYEGRASHGGCTSGGQPGSLGQSSSSSVTEENTEADTVTVASSSKITHSDPSGLPSRPDSSGSAAHDLVRHLREGVHVNKEGTFLTELMTSCVATLFMLQSLSDKPYSAADVQQTMDSALMTLRPKSSSNSFIYKEIKQQIAIVKTQITAHIPVPSLAPLVDMSDGLTSTTM